MMIGFIGCGQMAQALAKGFVNAQLFNHEDIFLSDGYQPSLDAMSQLKFKTTLLNKDIVQQCEVIIIAVKPKDVSNVINNDIKPNWSDTKLLVSICAGVTLQQIKEVLGSSARSIRVMPNVCCLVGASASCFAKSPSATNADCELVSKMFNAVGRCYEITENYMDAVTGLSGSGPAFIFMLIDSMSDAGVKGGLPRDVARGLAAQTVLGSAKMVLETNQHPGQLKDQVTSPGGTTIAGVAELEKTGFRNAIISAIDAARIKSQEMSK